MTITTYCQPLRHGDYTLGFVIVCQRGDLRAGELISASVVANSTSQQLANMVVGRAVAMAEVIAKVSA